MTGMIDYLTPPIVNAGIGFHEAVVDAVQWVVIMSTLMMGAETVSKMLVWNSVLTSLITQEDFIAFLNMLHVLLFLCYASPYLMYKHMSCTYQLK
jgi:hypothetical protein